MKKLITLLILMMATATSLLAVDFEYNGVNYTVIHEEAKLCKTKDGIGRLDQAVPGNTVSGKLVIPEKVTNEGAEYTVVLIGNYSFAKNDVTSVELPQTVTQIGDGAFYGCIELLSISLPQNLKQVGTDVFSECKSLQSIILPNSLIELGNSMFSGCASLKMITLPKNIKFFPISCFSYCGFETIDIPETIASIGFACFRGCKYLKSINLSQSIKEVGGYAFEGCESIESIDFSFIECIPQGVCEGCSKLKYVKFSENTRDLASYSFIGTNIEYLELPDKITSLNTSSFLRCSNLKVIKLPNKLQYIDDTFKECNAITDIYCYAQVPPVCSFTFSSYLGYTTLHVLEGYKDAYAASTPWNAFGTIVEDGKIQVEGITLQSSLTIRKGVNSQLKATITPSQAQAEIIWASENPEIATVSETGLVTGFAEGSTNITATCGDFSATCEVRVLPSVTSGDYFDSGIFKYFVANQEKKEVYLYRTNTTDNSIPTSLSIPESVTYDEYTYNVASVLNNAFNGCDDVTKIELPNSVKSINYSAFNGCNSLEEVRFGTGLESISNGAFGNDTKVKVIFCPAIIPPTVVGGVFPTSLYENATVVVPEQSLKQYVHQDAWNRFRNYLTTNNGISLSHYEVEMAADEVFQLGIYNADENVIWETSNPDVAYANDCGLIVAKGITGTTEISANVGGEKLCCRVLVSTPTRGERIAKARARISSSTDVEDIEPAAIKVESVSGNPPMLNVRLHPVGACTVINWKSSDESLATVDHGIITVHGDGDVNFTTTTENGLEHTYSATVGNGEVTGIEDIVVDNTTIANNVYDLTGRCVILNATQEQINALNKGVYIVNGKKILVK